MVGTKRTKSKAKVAEAAESDCQTQSNCHSDGQTDILTVGNNSNNSNNNDGNNNEKLTTSSENSADQESTCPKKRGRKPRGSKIIEMKESQEESNVVLPNVIIQFHCKLETLVEHLKNTVNDDAVSRHTDYSKYTDIENSNGLIFDNIGSSQVNGKNANKKQSKKQRVASNITNEVIPNDTVHAAKGHELGFAYVNENTDVLHEDNQDNDENWAMTYGNTCQYKDIINQDTKQSETYMQNDNSDIIDKIHEMEVNFHNNNINGKRSSCFWDTCAFDTPPFYIPKSIDTDNVRPYGCFCSLNCALAYLQHEDIDASSKFERRQLLFRLYSDIVGNKSFVKPAPNPRYTLDKYYGNLSIQQWRSLLAGDRMLLIVDKPLTPELPELHTETIDRFITMGCVNTAEAAQYGKFKIRKVAPKQSKGAIVAEKFGVVSSAK